MTLSLVGIGLDGVEGITSEALDEIRRGDVVLLDSYTSFVDEHLMDALTQVTGKTIMMVGRRELEDELRKTVEMGRRNRVVILVPGDPLIATTHMSIRILTDDLGVETRVVHGVSVTSAAPSASGLQIYKFGKTVTIPRTDNPDLLSAPYMGIAENQARGLHTLVLLDTAEGGLTIGEALTELLEVEEKLEKGIATRSRLVVGIARAGNRDVEVHAGRLDEVRKAAFRGKPQCLVFPGDLHFVETEALIRFGGAERQHVEGHLTTNEVTERAKRYVEKAEKVLKRIQGKEVEAVGGLKVGEVVEQAANYVQDTKHFLLRKDSATALASVSYAEGLLDALRLLKLADFSWD